MPIDRPTFSESWYRVVDLTPRLATAVKIHRQYFRGQVWYILQDPTNDNFFRLSRAAYHFVVMLDGRHRPIGYQVVSVGTATASLVHPREVFQAAVSLGAVALIVAHNHPSGDPTPSPEDRAVTERLVRCGEVLGIRILDSLVVADAAYHSMREEQPDVFDGAGGQRRE